MRAYTRPEDRPALGPTCVPYNLSTYLTQRPHDVRLNADDTYRFGTNEHKHQH